MIWEEAVAFALSLPDTELSTSYGKPAVKLLSNGRAFLYSSRETETSFGIAMDLDSIDVLKATEPETYWQTAHYEGWPAVLVRYRARDEERVREVIRRSRDWSASLPKARSRKQK
jgi:hypothetical protein